MSTNINTSEATAKTDAPNNNDLDENLKPILKEVLISVRDDKNWQEWIKKSMESFS